MTTSQKENNLRKSSLVQKPAKRNLFIRIMIGKIRIIGHIRLVHQIRCNEAKYGKTLRLKHRIWMDVCCLKYQKCTNGMREFKDQQKGLK